MERVYGLPRQSTDSVESTDSVSVGLRRTLSTDSVESTGSVMATEKRRDRDRDRDRRERGRSSGRDKKRARPVLVAAAEATEAAKAAPDVEEVGGARSESTEEEEPTTDREMSPGETRAAKAAPATERSKDRDDNRTPAPAKDDKGKPAAEAAPSKEGQPAVKEEPPKGDLRKPAEPARGKFQCPPCERTVGGGVSGWWQHRRSPYHLAAWVYYRQTGQKRQWSLCLVDGKNWSKDLWEKCKTGPPVGDELPVDRADPERKKRDRRDPNDPDGPGGFGSSGGKQ
eukprot:s366_g73.t1